MLKLELCLSEGATNTSAQLHPLTSQIHTFCAFTFATLLARNVLQGGVGSVQDWGQRERSWRSVSQKAEDQAVSFPTVFFLTLWIHNHRAQESYGKVPSMLCLVN